VIISYAIYFKIENMMIKNLDRKYFEKLGPPNPGRPFDKIDEYRFNLAFSKLSNGSVLDIGTYFGDFLKKILARNPLRKIGGTDVNMERVNLSNKNIGKNVVKLDFINGVLKNFKNMT